MYPYELVVRQHCLSCRQRRGFILLIKKVTMKDLSHPLVTSFVFQELFMVFDWRGDYIHLSFGCFGLLGSQKMTWIFCIPLATMTVLLHQPEPIAREVGFLCKSVGGTEAKFSTAPDIQFPIWVKSQLEKDSQKIKTFKVKKHETSMATHHRD